MSDPLHDSIDRRTLILNRLEDYRKVVNAEFPDASIEQKAVLIAILLVEFGTPCTPDDFINEYEK